MKRQKGFTLIELLVVIAIIGLLATIAAVALNNARTSSRDTKRVADIKQIQTGLELYFNARTTYPYDVLANQCDGTEKTRVSTIDDDCKSGDDVNTTIRTFLAGIDNIKDPSGSTTACVLGATAACDYAYVDNSTKGDKYTIYFYLEQASGSLPAGLRTASETGIQ